jgi:uncharacterized HAD superfamily protein
MKPKAVIMDIDGVLGDSTEMVETCLNDKGFLDIEKANKLVPSMPVNKWADSLLDAMFVSHDIFIVTARRDSIRDITEQWLKDNYLFHSKLYTKPEGSKLRDEEYKLNVLNEISKTHEVLFMVEDAPKTVKLLRANNYLVLQPNNLYKEEF